MTGTIVYVTMQGQGEWQGASTHARSVVSGLRREGWEVLVHAPLHQDVRPSPWRRIRELLAVQLRAIRDLDRADLLYVRHHPLAAVLAAAADRRDVPRVEEVNGTITDMLDAHPVVRPIRRVLLALSNRLLHSATAVRAVSEVLAADVCGGCPRVHVIPNGVDLDLFSPAGPPTDPPVVLFVGALAPWQGLDTLVRARRDPAWPDRVSLAVVGDGPLRGTVERDPLVDYRGAVPHDVVPDHMRPAFVTVIPKEERARGSSPLKLYESLACGVPVVVTDIPPQSQLTRAWGCGRVVPTGDAAAIATAVADLVASPHERDLMGRRGRQAVEQGHSWEARTADLSHLLAELVHEGRA